MSYRQNVEAELCAIIVVGIFLLVGSLGTCFAIGQIIYWVVMK